MIKKLIKYCQCKVKVEMGRGSSINQQQSIFDSPREEGRGSRGLRKVKGTLTLGFDHIPNLI